MRRARAWLAAGLALACACAAAASPQEAEVLRQLLAEAFLADVPHVVAIAEAPDDGPLGFVVHVPVVGVQDRTRTDRTATRLTAQAMQIIARAFPGRPIAPWSAVMVGVRSEGPRRAPPSGPEAMRATPLLGAATVGGGTAPRSITQKDPIAATRAASLPVALADRLRRELAPIYPDARVEVIGRGPARVEVWVTVITPQPSSANGPWIVDYVRRIIETVALKEFPGVQIVGGPNVGIRPLGRPDGEDLPPRDLGLANSRPAPGVLGLSRQLEGRMRQELSTRFPTVECTVSFVNPREAIFELRAESNGALTRANRAALRDYLRITALTVLANEHPDIRLSARSRFTVWTRVTLPVELPKPRVERTTGFGSKLATLRARVIELPTAHTLFAGHRQSEVTAYRRTVKDGLYDNIVRLETGGLDLGYRQGLVRGLELNVVYRTHVLGAGVRDPTTFTGASRGISVLTGSLKFTPFRYKGMELGGGVSQSLVSDLDRPHFLPDDWERLSNLFVVFSTPFAPGFRAHVAALQSFIPASGPSDSATVLVGGLAVEWLPFEELRLAVEGVSERLSGTSVGELGAVAADDEGNSAFDNAHANASVTWGLHSIGDISAYGRKLNREVDREFGVSYFRRF